MGNNESGSRIGIGILAEGDALAVRERRSHQLTSMKFSGFMPTRSWGGPSANLNFVPSSEGQGVSGADIFQLMPWNSEAHKGIFDTNHFQREITTWTGEYLKTDKSDQGGPEQSAKAKTAVIDCGERNAPTCESNSTENNRTGYWAEALGLHKNSIVASELKLTELTERAPW